jgi:hypothetical protein
LDVKSVLSDLKLFCPSKQTNFKSKNLYYVRIPNSFLKNIVEWRQEQIDPMMQCKVGDLWAKGGLKDPFSDPLLISQAKEILEKTKYRLELNPSMKVPWDGDWRTALAKDREVEAQRNAVLAEGSKNSNFVTGG